MRDSPDRARTERLPSQAGTAEIRCLANLSSVAAATLSGMNLLDSSGGGLAPIDWIIIALYAVGTILVGSYYSRRQTSLEEYFTGGGRMNPTLIGVSLMATSLSTIGFLSIPGEAISKGPAGLANQLAHPFIFVVVGFIFVPLFMRTRVISAYELLEDRLGLGIRMLGAVLFLLFRLVWMSLLVFLAARALAIMMGLDESSVPWITLLTGLIAVTYTSLGGLRAVVITDAFQTLCMLGGALLVIGLVSYRMGGIGWVPTSWQPHWDHQPLFSFDPSVRLSILGTIFSTFVLTTAGLAGDQTKIQRLMATTDVKAARRAYVTNQVVGVTVVLTLWLVGFALLGLARSSPDLLPPGFNIETSGDSVFPYFISHLLPPGISGLVVAAMLAAAMSSIDSGVNSITAVVYRDFLQRFGRLPSDPRVQARWAKILALVIGAVIVLGSSLMGDVHGNIWALTKKTSGLLLTPMFGLFFFAFFVPFARPLGVAAGALCGLVTALLLAYSGPIFGMDPVTGRDPVSFLWIAPGALAVNLTVGTIISYGLHVYYGSSGGNEDAGG